MLRVSAGAACCVLLLFLDPRRPAQFNLERWHNFGEGGRTQAEERGEVRGETEGVPSPGFGGDTKRPLQTHSHAHLGL
uniref:Putative secreted protein n=1 Tax=Anopheles triannulatus TaxID=58253 RepID=A0A2M4B2D8_9DIPT